jgi:hypothetical protein
LDDLRGFKNLAMLLIDLAVATAIVGAATIIVWRR